MLNRRILRIKAFKLLYSYAENPSMSLQDALAELELSCRATRDLYLFMLALIPAVTAEARDRIESARRKFNPTEEERNPNFKFAENALAAILSNDPDFTKIIGRQKLSWDQYDAFVRKLYETVRTREYFTEYMDLPESSVAQDVALFTRIFEEELVDDADLEDILEDLSIYWNDDLAYALTSCCKSIESLSRGELWSLPPIYLSEMSKSSGLDSDKAFVTRLVSAAYSGYERYLEKVARAVPKWDKERLVIIDTILIICGLAEAETFPEIPVKVTINEYVDISKYYSTPKSRSFVNGLLDTIIQGMIDAGEIRKSGRGLM